MDFLGHLRGLWVVVLLLPFSCVPSEGQPPPPRKSIVPFPPGKPTLANLKGICDNVSKRPRYDLNSLPSPGFSYLRRYATAVNSIEASYQDCCKPCGTEDKSATLKCASDAWLNHLSTYCESESMVMTMPYHCCENYDMYRCFETAAPNPSYQHPPPQN
ncbi:hypothetical protein SKAU_G00407050 [Synaphobranchus kaupii]|uniref:Uncharacterized protein n=1 Tax=Synaphobranchus kaupii TaxID=118154 RepID=A0A9Q1EA80_SYNKA|nr:hypothetical protein SKAU_G00407050 [Synaphobranchus kaupii]